MPHRSFIRIHGDARKFQRRLGLEIHALLPDDHVEDDPDIPYSYSPENPANCSHVLRCPYAQDPDRYFSLCISDKETKAYEECPDNQRVTTPTFLKEISNPYRDDSIDHLVNCGELPEEAMIELGRHAEYILQKDADESARVTSLFRESTSKSRDNASQRYS